MPLFSRRLTAWDHDQSDHSTSGFSPLSGLPGNSRNRDRIQVTQPNFTPLRYCMWTCSDNSGSDSNLTPRRLSTTISALDGAHIFMVVPRSILGMCVQNLTAGHLFSGCI